MGIAGVYHCQLLGAGSTGFHDNMIEFIKRWFQRDDERPAPKAAPVHYRAKVARKTPVASPSNPAPRVQLDSSTGGTIEDGGPGKNVLVRPKYLREDTGTHDTLKIIDEDSLNDGDEDGIDPYNTGKFDRSKHWDKRFRN